MSRRKVPDLVAETDAVVAEAAAASDGGVLVPVQAARAAALRLAAAVLVVAEPRDVAKSLGEWRAALREFVNSSPREGSFAERLRDDSF